MHQPNIKTECIKKKKKKRPIYILPTRDTLQTQRTYRLRVKGLKKIFHVNENQKKARVAILISDKIDLKIKNIISDKEGHYKIIKGSIQEEDITTVNIYAPNIGAS